MIYSENLSEIRQQVAFTGRKVALIAATKTQTTEIVDKFMSLAPDFCLGENRVQELMAKYNPSYRWHFIGQLQTNKVKYIIDKVDLIQSLDRDELAREIEKQATKCGKIQDCLVEVNMGAEITKGGVAPDDVVRFVKSLEKYPHIRVKGLMSVLPNLGDTPKLHTLYESLYDLYEDLKHISVENTDIEYLSMGMSNDYKIALQHGSNMLRLGRVLFGERTYPNQV